MLFPDDALFNYVLLDLAEQIVGAATPPIQPLPCDRYVARSCLQKAVRRGEVELAQRALANLFNHDRRAAWRHIAIIAAEDVGVSNIDLLAYIVAAQKNRKWREQMGGDWLVMAELVRQMAISEHCQAACDLLLKATNDPVAEPARSGAIDADPRSLAATLATPAAGLIERGVAALAIGGGLFEGQRLSDPCAVFDIVGDTSRSTHVVATCRAAWKLSRNPMTLLLPLVWELWITIREHDVIDDEMPPVSWIGDVPGFALDQFTRIGNTVSRALLKQDPYLQLMLADQGIATVRQARALGDLLFIAEGGLVVRRAVWGVARDLRLPYRHLPAVAALSGTMPLIQAHLRSKAREIEFLRHQHLHAAQSTAA